MKFAVFTVVVLALVFSANSSVIPLGLGGIGPVLAVSSPLVSVAVPGSVAVQASVVQPPQGSVAVQASVAQPLQGSVAVQVPVQAVQPVVAVAQAPVVVQAPVAVHAPVAVAAEGTYVAKTRGAVHVAPLAGHLQSAASVNLQPAPGTL